MFEGALVFILLGLVLLLAVQRGKWRQRAHDAEAQNKADQKARAIQNRVVTDRAYRKRVRARFDEP